MRFHCRDQKYINKIYASLSGIVLYTIKLVKTYKILKFQKDITKKIYLNRSHLDLFNQEKEVSNFKKITDMFHFIQAIGLVHFIFLRKIFYYR